MLVDTMRLFSCSFTIPPKVVHHHRLEGLEAIFQGGNMALVTGLSAVIVVNNNAFHIGDTALGADAILGLLLHIALGTPTVISTDVNASCGQRLATYLHLARTTIGTCDR